MPHRSSLTQPQHDALKLASRGRLTETNAAAATLNGLWEHGWITWADGRAFLTDQGQQALNTASDQPRFLADIASAHDTADTCQRCGHVRGAHGIHPERHEHLDCLEKDCGCQRYIAGLETMSDRGYTTSPSRALVSAGEAVDDAWQKQITANAHARHGHRKTIDAAAELQARELLALEDRIADLQAKAHTAGVVVRSELKALKRMLEDDQPEPTVVRQVRRTEAKIYRQAA